MDDNFWWSGNISLLSLDERNSFCRRPRNLQWSDLVGTNGQRSTTYTQPQIPYRCSCCPVSPNTSFLKTLYIFLRIEYFHMVSLLVNSLNIKNQNHTIWNRLIVLATFILFSQYRQSCCHCFFGFLIIRYWRKPYYIENRYLIASHTTDYRHPWLFFNTLAVMVLVVAKFPNMHKVRIFGINGDK